MAIQSSKIVKPSEKATERVLPSARIEAELNRTSDEAKREARLREVLNLTFKTPEGKEALAYILRLCGYQSSSLVCDPQSLEVNTKSMIWNEARREMYVNHIRKFLDKDLLREIENG